MRLVSGNRADAAQTFERLYRESYSLVYNFVLRRTANRDAAEDVVSEAYLHAARAFDRFDQSRARFSTWVIAIARNCLNDCFAKDVPVTPVDELIGELPSHERPLDDNVTDTLLVERLLSVLDEEERELVFMKYYGGKRNSEIAEALGMNASTVSTKLSRALAKMRATAS